MDGNIVQKLEKRQQFSKFPTGLYHHKSNDNKNNVKQSSSIIKYTENCHHDVDVVDNPIVWESKRNRKCFQGNVDDKMTSTTITSTTNESNDSCCLLNEESQNHINESKRLKSIANSDTVDDETNMKKKSFTLKLLFSGLTKKFSSNMSHINSLLNFHSQGHRRSLNPNQKESSSCTNSPCKTEMYQLKQQQHTRSYDQINIYGHFNIEDYHCRKSLFSDHQKHLVNDSMIMCRGKKKSRPSIDNFWRKYSENERIYDEPTTNVCNSSSNNSSSNSCSSVSTSSSNENHTSSSTLIITSYDCYDDCIQAAIHILKKKGINFKEQP